MPTTIPPIIHFIWAGGTKLMSNEGLDLVSRWTLANKEVQDLQVWLWVDKKTAAQNMITFYQQEFAEQGITVLVEGEHERNLQTLSSPSIILKDIDQNRLRNEFVAYEIDKLRPNYGSSSDLLRYEILVRFGGFYCDCSDVEPGKDGLATIFSQCYESTYIMYLEHFPQQPAIEPQKLAVFHTQQLGNDTFATNKGNHAALQLLLQARRNYDLPETFSLAHIVTAHSGNNIKDTTIARTGPALVRQVLLRQLQCQEKDGVLSDPNKLNEIRRVRDGQLALVTPTANTGNWLNMRIVRYDNPEDAIAQVIKTIEFEAKHFKILRLDDHISDLIASTSNKLTPNQALNRLNSIIQNRKSDIKYTQLTGKFAETIHYISNSKMPSLFLLSAEIAIQAINAQAYLNDLLRAEEVATQQKATLSAQAKENNMSVECLILASQRPEVIQNLCSQMTLRSAFIDDLSQYLDRFTHSEDIKQYLMIRLQKDKEYAEILNSRVTADYRVNISNIDNLLAKLNPATAVQGEAQSSKMNTFTRPRG